MTFPSTFTPHCGSEIIIWTLEKVIKLKEWQFCRGSSRKLEVNRWWPLWSQLLGLAMDDADMTGPLLVFILFGISLVLVNYFIKFVKKLANQNSLWLFVRTVPVWICLNLYSYEFNEQCKKFNLISFIILILARIYSFV